jgi:[ribosomal protein S5]-alanine N-acetyltransferase
VSDVSEILTPRLRMRCVGQDDIAAVVAISTDPEANRHRPGGAPSQAQAEAIVQGFIEDWERNGIGYWVIECDGEIVGIAGVKPFRLDGRDYWNLYYRFSPSSWGQGLAREAAQRAVEVAQQHAPERPVIARTRADNGAAIRLAVAIGMRRAPEIDSDGFITYAIGG